MNIFSRVTPRMETKGYTPMFLRAIQRNRYFYISPGSLQDEKIDCWKRTKIEFSEWLTQNSLAITGVLSNGLHKIYRH